MEFEVRDDEARGLPAGMFGEETPQSVVHGPGHPLDKSVAELSEPFSAGPIALIPEKTEGDRKQRRRVGPGGRSAAFSVS